MAKEAALGKSEEATGEKSPADATLSSVRLLRVCWLG